MVPHDAELRQGSRKFKIGEKSFNGYENNKLWRNDGNGAFTEVGFVAGLDTIVDSRSCAVADFDRDGKLDIALRTMYERSFFHRNVGQTGRFLHVSLQGTKSNRMGVGARVEVHAGKLHQIADLTCGSGFLSQHESALHFGLGSEAKVDLLTIRWPSGLVQNFKDIPADRFMAVTEGRDEPVLTEPRQSPPAQRKPDEDVFITTLKNGTYNDLNGKSAALSSLMKPLTLIHVWSPACTGCEKEVGTLNKLHEFVDGTDFTILAVAVDTTIEKVTDFAAKTPLKYPTLVADEVTAQRLMRIPQVPWSHVAQFGGWFEVGTSAPEISTIPWSGIIDAAGFQRRYRGPIKYFEAKLDILESIAELRRGRNP